MLIFVQWRTYSAIHEFDSAEHAADWIDGFLTICPVANVWPMA